MAWHSLLPDNLSVLETWIARIFILLAILTIAPWAVLIFYDVLLYIWRSITYETPFVGGRARGKQRPPAPSLKEPPDGHATTFTLVRSPAHTEDSIVRATGTQRFAAATANGTVHEETEK